ncbi:MAG: hypothetical protein MK085_02700, partial [Phycisphaerales bacterium]|nr:hypothetical protein [Phycisphaerales bacterium]
MKKILTVRGSQAEDILGLVKCVATANDSVPLHDVHKQTIHAIAEHLFHTDLDADAIVGTLDRAAEKVVDPEIRRETLNIAGIMPFLEEEHEDERIATFAQLARDLGFSRKFARELHKLCHHSVTEIGLCQLRGLTMESGKRLWHAPVIMGESLFHLDGNKKQLARYEGFRDLDDKILGKVMTKYYDDNHFPLPGTPNAVFSNMLKIHDMHHVICGYPTTPLGEICVIGFGAGMADVDLGKALIGYVAQFQVGIQFDKGLGVWKNQFNPDIVLRAYERGGECSVNFDTYD